MDLSKTVALAAVVLVVLLAAGYTLGDTGAQTNEVAAAQAAR